MGTISVRKTDLQLEREVDQLKDDMYELFQQSHEITNEQYSEEDLREVANKI